jgi:hypothetical protein
MSKNEVWEGEMKAQKKWVVRKAKDEKKKSFSQNWEVLHFRRF